MFDIVSFGSATVDFFIKSKDFDVNSRRISLALSSKNEITESLITSGGGATNSAVAFARLGLKSAPVSLIGTDPFSRYIFTDLSASSRISSDLIVSHKKESTDYSVILVTDNGARSILTNRGSSRLEERHIRWSQIKSASWFYISSLEGNLDLLEKLIGFAQEQGIRIALNPGRRELEQKASLRPLLSHVNVLLLNRSEAEVLTGTSHLSQIESKALSLRAPVIVVTDGRRGAHVFTPEQKLYSPIVNSTPVDETGAGDAFGAAFVAALARHLSPNQALNWGIRNSASVVSRLGAKPGLLTLSQISSF